MWYRLMKSFYKNKKKVAIELVTEIKIDENK
jgi:hypothetical protein